MELKKKKCFKDNSDDNIEYIIRIQHFDDLRNISFNLKEAVQYSNRSDRIARQRNILFYL